VDIAKGIALLGDPPMPQRKSCPDSFKKDAVRRLMARGSKTVAEVARELGVSQGMLHRWRERFGQKLGRPMP